MRKHDLKFKHKVVQDYRSGKGGYKILAGKYGIAESMVRSWVAAYEHHGFSGLDRQRRQYTLEFKLEVLHRRATESLSYRELGALYNIGNPHSITRWQQQYEHGKLRGARNSPSLDSPMSEQKNLPSQSAAPDAITQVDDLLRENQRLRAEVAYLKKVRALALAKTLASQKRPK